MSLGSHFEREQLSSNRFRHVQRIKPIAYLRNGAWRRITNHLGPTNDPGFPFGSDELLQFRLKTAITGQSPLLHFGRGQSHIRFTPLGTANVVGRAAGLQGFEYPEAWPNADLRFTIAGHRLQKEIVLRAGHPTQFQFRIDDHAGLDIATLSTHDFRILQPTLEPPAGSAELVKPLKWLITQQGGKTILTVNLPLGDWAGWTLDPTLTLQPGAADGKDNMIDGGGGEFNLINNGVRVSSVTGNNTRGLVEFDLSTISSAATIISATLYMYQSQSESALAWTVTVFSIAIGNAAWIEGTQHDIRALAGESCWNALAADGAGGVTTAWAGSAGLGTSGTDYESESLGSFSGNKSDSNGTEYSALLTANRIQGWIASPDTNYGLFLKPSTAVGGIASSDHATAADRPKLVVEYSLPIKPGSIWSPAKWNG